MCGIVGIFSNTGLSNGHDTGISLRTMAATLEHRGPDAEGFWTDQDYICLAHRRLSILDLSPAGAQPMQSACGRYVIVFNGEIYNHMELRADLECSGISKWRGHSDTEVLLTAISQFGIDSAVQRISGMFAFALWDKTNKVLTLARDRIGEKPLYYGWIGSSNHTCFAFSSELKAIKAHPAFNATINREALSLYFRNNYIPAPYTIYANICKLKPGQLLSISVKDPRAVCQDYWSISGAAIAGNRTPFKGTDEDAIIELEGILTSAVKQQMTADVPIGAFLSGGVDSSAVVALMQSLTDRQVSSFSIGFEEHRHNEAHHAMRVAQHLGTVHYDLRVTAAAALEVIPSLSEIYCEPFGDSSQIPTVLLSRFARQQVKVCLAGDGGDELFGGYNRYLIANILAPKLKALPRPVRRYLTLLLTSFNPATWDFVISKLDKALPFDLRGMNVGERLHKVGSFLRSDLDTSDSVYSSLSGYWGKSELVIGSGGDPVESQLTVHSEEVLDLPHKLMLLDFMRYLPDDILVKVDRATMASGLECRAPFLDHRLVEFAWSLPSNIKFRDGQGKWILRRMLERRIPRRVFDRPKQGFTVPLADWLRGPLRDWAEYLLSEQKLREANYLNPEPIRQKWCEHLSGKRNWQDHLWSVIMFQSWLQKQ